MLRARRLRRGVTRPTPRRRVIGTWELSELTGASEDDMAMMKAFGLTIEATFAEDGTFKLGMFGETMDGTWDAKSADKVSLTIEGDSIDATIKDGVLSIEVDGEGMKFKKTSDEVKDLGSSSVSSDGATSGSSATDDQAIQAIDKEIYSDDNISVMVVDKKQDWLDSCGYTLVITNKSADTAIDFSGSYGHLDGERQDDQPLHLRDDSAERLRRDVHDLHGRQHQEHRRSRERAGLFRGHELQDLR